MPLAIKIGVPMGLLTLACAGIGDPFLFLVSLGATVVLVTMACVKV